jgi:hypothetical protein
MKVCSLLLALAFLAGCQQTSIPTASSGERGIDPLSRNLSQTQGGSVRGPVSLNPPPIRPVTPEIAVEGR